MIVPDPGRTLKRLGIKDWLSACLRDARSTQGGRLPGRVQCGGLVAEEVRRRRVQLVGIDCRCFALRGRSFYNRGDSRGALTSRDVRHQERSPSEAPVDH